MARGEQDFKVQQWNLKWDYENSQIKVSKILKMIYPKN
jgi:hypothetical protein